MTAGINDVELLRQRVAELARENSELIDQLARSRDSFQWIKDHVCGEAIPNWQDSMTTTMSRGKIADVCDMALESLPKAS